MTNNLHFENLWQEAELFSKSENLNIDLILSELKFYVSELYKESYQLKLNQEQTSVLIGKILYVLAALSCEYNIDVFKALNDELQDHLIKKLEEECNYVKSELPKEMLFLPEIDIKWKEGKIE